MSLQLLTRQWLSVSLTIVLLSILLGAVPAGAAPAAVGPCTQPHEFKHYFRVGKACRMPNGMLRMKLADGKFYETHGLDAPGILRNPARSVVRNSAVTAAATPYVCATDARRVMAIYAYPSDAPDRSSTYIPYIRQQFQQANDMMSNAAAAFGVSLSLKVACDPDGQVTVRVVRMGFPRSQTDVDPVFNDLIGKGYSVTGQKNWIWFDGDTCGGGVAYGLNDDRPGAENSANNAVGYALSWGQCPYTYILHEGTHSMGGVVNTAPNSTGAGHCTDDSDVMCYNDGGPRASLYRNNACPGTGLDDFYDCHNDDYFHPSPPVGNFLATHWNIGGCNNLMIVRSGCGGNPTPTNTVGASTPTRTNTPAVTNTLTRTPTRTNTPAVTNTPTSTLGASPTRTSTPGAITNTPTRTATVGVSLTPTRTLTPGIVLTATPTSGGGVTCSPVTSTITAPFTFDGAGTLCWQSSNLGTYINSWNTTSITINGANVTNLYVASGSYPAKVNGFWYVSYSSNVAWGHFEAK